MTAWPIPRVFQGATVAILASGPSMTAEAAEKVRAAGLPAIAVNTTFRLAPWAEWLHGADAAWWKHTPGALTFAGIRTSMEEVQGVHLIARAGRVGCGDEKDSIYTLGNSGAQAIQLAVKAGAARVLLLGMDMSGGHWHGEHSAPLRSTHPDIYAVWRDWMGTLAAGLEQRGIEVLNCSPDSALTCWPKVGLDEALRLHAQ